MLSVRWESRVQRAWDLITEAVLAHGTSQRPLRRVYGLFSGGHDSLTATAIAAQHPKFSGVIHINTGIGIEATRDFVRKTCAEHGWPLFEIKALEDCGQDYERLVLQHGFPGPPRHAMMYHRLKERALRHFFKVYVPMPERAALVSGRRSQESLRRMANVERYDRVRRRVFVSAIHDWTACEVTDFISEHGLRRNPVVDLLHMSGECLCGAFAREGELEEIATWFPEVAARIRVLESRVREAGHSWGWEGRKPKGRRRRDEAQINLPLCFSCQGRNDAGDLVMGTRGSA